MLQFWVMLTGSKHGALLGCDIWGFPKISDTFLGVPIIRTIVFWGLHWGPLMLGNYRFTLWNNLVVGSPEVEIFPLPPFGSLPLRDAKFLPVFSTRPHTEHVSLQLLLATGLCRDSFMLPLYLRSIKPQLTTLSALVK